MCLFKFFRIILFHLNWFNMFSFAALLTYILFKYLMSSVSICNVESCRYCEVTALAADIWLASITTSIDSSVNKSLIFVTSAFCPQEGAKLQVDVNVSSWLVRSPRLRSKKIESLQTIHERIEYQVCDLNTSKCLPRLKIMLTSIWVCLSQLVVFRPL